MNANETKGLCIALLFVDTLIFGWPPYLLVRGGNQSSRSIRIRTAVISYLTCFAGGVFFGACLLHLLAEGRESMEEYFKSVRQDLDFPVYECVLAGGFFAIAFVEQIAHNLLHKRTSNDGAPGKAAIQAMEVNPLRAFLLLGALSFHTVFDGLAVGLEESGTGVWEMFTAICIHKSLVAVCLGLQLFLAFKARPLMGFIWVFVFSLISPLGVGLGMILTSGDIDENAENLSSWILQAMATGTFLYVTVFEILREEFTERGSILKIFVAILGFGGMALAKYFDKD
ncbi:unnamed protein product [Candidula unifasciata]|uniref:Zinc transporter ZIP1 n=1 Tax=Candidula unifasciata TaxID=100452 RepID=A0A8S3ZEN7_9EUPU|nr:unnamed protein product [Candidula unifasciata]